MAEVLPQAGARVAVVVGAEVQAVEEALEEAGVPVVAEVQGGDVAGREWGF